jgi:predicted RNA binding protein YcfA (HicA-like mRNA interferase family)
VVFQSGVQLFCGGTPPLVRAEASLSTNLTIIAGLLAVRREPVESLVWLPNRLDARRALRHTCRRVKVREVIATLEADGWKLVRTRGSHRQFRHQTKAGTVTVAGKLGVDVPIGTLGSIWKQAGLKKD